MLTIGSREDLVGGFGPCEWVGAVFPAAMNLLMAVVSSLTVPKVRRLPPRASSGGLDGVVAITVRSSTTARLHGAKGVDAAVEMVHSQIRDTRFPLTSARGDGQARIYLGGEQAVLRG